MTEKYGIELLAEKYDQLAEAMKSATIIANQAGARIRRLETFICTIARTNFDGEERDGSPPFVMENDDAVDTLNSLIQQARDIVPSVE
jgi:hypothetical protein